MTSTKTTLEDITHSEIILSLILLKPGKRNFRVEDLHQGLKDISTESSRLRISWDSISNTFFFYEPYLTGELNFPHYRLSEEGKAFLQREFATYSPELQHRLTELAEKVWGY